MVSDPDLVAVESFEAFYRNAWHEIHRAVALGVGNADLASEAVDEAMVRAYERWSEVSQFENREGWVYRVAMNWARSWLRRLRYRSVFDVPDVGIDDPDVVDPKVLEAVRRLSFRHREVVIARFVLDLSEAEISETLGVPKGTVYPGGFWILEPACVRLVAQPQDQEPTTIDLPVGTTCP